MRPARRAALPSLALLALLAMPSTAVAADPVAISGTVVRDGAPVTGVAIVVTVLGSDQAVATATDEQGAFTVAVEAEAGSTVRIDATGRTSRSTPDARGCSRLETPTGSLTFVIEALPAPPVEVALDGVLSGTACEPATPRVTPPATDAVASPSAGASGAGLLVVLGALSLLAGGLLTAGARSPRRRP